MKITISMDNILRANFKITARLSLDDFGTLLTFYLMDFGIEYSIRVDETKRSHTKRVRSEVRDLINKMSTKEIRENISEVILGYGLETPSYKIGDEVLCNLSCYVTSLLAKRFKGFKK